MTRPDPSRLWQYVIWGIVLLMLIGGRYAFFLFVPLVLAGILFYFIKTKKPQFDFTTTSSTIKLPNISMPSFQFKSKYIVWGTLLLVVLFIIIDGLVSVPAGHVGVIYDRGRGVLEREYDEGLHLKIPFWQVATVMDTRLQAFTMSVSEQERARYYSEPIEALTRDGQKVDIDATIQFRVSGDKASDVYQQIGLDYVEKVVKPGARSVVRSVITGYDSTKLFTEESRIEAAEKMRGALKALYGQSNVQLIDLLLRNVRFADVYLKAIEDKQVAQQRIQMAEYQKLEAEELKKKKIIEAQAEAEAIRLKGETLRTNPSVIQFEFVQKMAPNIQWGILPDGAVPFLDLKSFGR